MAARNPARVLAPLALVAALVGVVVVVQASRPGSSEGPDRPSATQRTTTTQTQPAPRARPRFYVVKVGDTLSGVSEQTGVTLDEILRLNPDVDPNALQTGQRLRLAP